MADDASKRIFAKNLKYFMDLNQTKQVDLAKYLGCSTGLVSSWCSGRKMPRVNTINELAQIFHIEISDLITDKTHEQESGYYINEETKRIAQAIYDNPDMRSLFDISSKMPPERLKAHLEFMKKLQDSDV